MEGSMLGSVPPEQEHLRLFLRERFHSEPEAASFLGGADGLEASMSSDDFARALRLSGYGRPAEPLFAVYSNQNRVRVGDLLASINLPQEAKQSPKATATPSFVPPEVDTRSEGSNHGSRLHAASSTSQQFPPDGATEPTLPIFSRTFSELERELAQMRREMAVLQQQAAATPSGSRGFKADEALLQEAAAMRAESADARSSLTEALRLLAEERQERLNDRAEASRRHKELQIWSEDRLRNVEHLASEGRQCTTEVRAAVQEALQLGELSEFRALGAIAEESRNRDVNMQREQQIREIVTSELENRFRKMLSDERASRFSEAANFHEQLGRVEDSMTTERETQAKKMAEVTSRLDEVLKTMKEEKETRQVQIKEVAGRHDALRHNFADGTRELRDFDDDQQRRMISIENAVQTIAERLEQEMKASKQAMLDVRKELHSEVSQREENCSHLRGLLDGETRTRSEAVDRNLQLREDVELRIERGVRAMLHEERVAREESQAILEQRSAALQQELNFEKAKAAAQGRDLNQSLTELKDALSQEALARREEVALAVKSLGDVQANVEQGSVLRFDAESRLLQHITNLDALIKSEATARDEAIKKVAEEFVEARSSISKEGDMRDEFEARLARRMDEEKAQVEESLQKLERSALMAEAHGWGPEQLRNMLQEERRGREEGLQRLEAMMKMSEGHVTEERSAREEQVALMSTRVSQVYGEIEDLRKKSKQALTRCEEIHSMQEDIGREKVERQAEATGTELSLKELAARIDQVQQAADSRERALQQKITELMTSLENEVLQRNAANADMVKKQLEGQEEVPDAIAAERRRSEQALSKVEETLRQEAAVERQRREEANQALELRWQQLREATEEAIGRRLDQHGDVSLEVKKVAENLADESRSRQRAIQALTSDLKRFREEVSDDTGVRRQVDEGMRDQIAQLLKRVDQAQETAGMQDTTLAIALEELRKDLRSEISTRETSCDQFRQDMQHESLAKEEMISGANKSWQRATQKINEELRSTIRAETQEREEMRLRLEQGIADARQGIQEMRALSDKREADIGERVRLAAEALGDDSRVRKEKDEQAQQALEQLRRSVATEVSDRRELAESLAVRLQHLEAATNDEAASREEAERRTSRELLNLQARIQEEKAVREENVSRLDKNIVAQAAVRDDGLQRESKVREEALNQAMAAAQKLVKSEQVARDEERRDLVGRLQGLQLEQQQEREERSRLIRDLHASISKLQRLQADEEDARAQDSERLSTAVESIHENLRTLKQGGEDTWQRTQEVADELRASISRETAARAAKVEAVETSARELRSSLAAEVQQREACVQSLHDAVAMETQAREETASRERRMIEEDVGRAVREHRKGREEEDRKVQERVLEIAGALAEEREQRVEAMRVERLRTDEVKEDFSAQRKSAQREVEKLSTAVKRLEDGEVRRAKELENSVDVLTKTCGEIRTEAADQAQRSEQIWRNVENRAGEVEALFRSESRDRKELINELQRAIDQEVANREEAVATERRAREAGDINQDELCKIAIQDERAQRLLVMEQLNKEAAVLRAQLSEEASRRDDEKGHANLTLQKIRADLAEITSLRAADQSLARESLEQVQVELQEMGKLQKEEVEKIDTSLAALTAKTEGTARIAREQAVQLEAAVLNVQEELTRETEERGEALRRLDVKLGEERRQLEAAADSKGRSFEELLRDSEETIRQRIQEETRKTKASVDRMSTQMSALVEDVEKARSLQPEQAKEFARSLSQIQRQLSTEELGRQQAIVAMQRGQDALRDELLGEVRDRRQQITAASEEVTTLARSMQQREDRAEVFQKQISSEMADIRERLLREVRARESSLLQLESRAVSSRSAAVESPGGYPTQVVQNRSLDQSSMALTGERWRQAEEELERTRQGLAALKSEAANLSKAMASVDERSEAVRSIVGAVQGNLAEVQQRQSKTAEVEAQLAAAREELRRESSERKVEGSGLAARLTESAERLEWAEQQRLKAENTLLQDIMETKNELKREIRDREETQTKVISMVREESTRREEGLDKEARLRLEGEERSAQALQAAIREERRQRGQGELRLEDLAMADRPRGEKTTAGAIMNAPSPAAMEEQLRLKQLMLELQARVASSEARQKSAEERTVSMLDAIMNGLMPNQA